jgi:hypothetical protein
MVTQPDDLPLSTDLRGLFGHTDQCEHPGERLACPDCGMTLDQWLTVEEVRTKLGLICKAHREERGC